MADVLMIDDDLRLAGMLRDYLQAAGFTVRVAGNGAEGWDALAPLPDLVLLDLMLPDTDGLALCRRIRARTDAAAQVPILMLTAKGDPLDRVVGLELGADDYLPKPFEPRELLARLRALLRRGRSTDAAAAPLRFGRLSIDPGARRVELDGQLCALTAHQFDLLLALAQRAGRVLNREQLLDAVGGASGSAAFDRSIDVHIARIRAAIEDDPRQPKRVLTVRGSGYVFAKAQD